MLYLWLIVAAVVAYLLGSINFAVIFSNAFLKKDVRSLGSGNAGFLPGALTFICDALKGFLACFIGKLIFIYVCPDTVPWIYVAYMCGVACMLGHVFPIFFRFKGGKGVATSVGIFAVCCPIAIIIGLTVFALMVFLTKIVSLSSLIATVTVISLSLVFYNSDANIALPAVLSISMGVIVFLKHKDNIKRLIKGEEKKIAVRRKK